MKTFIIILVFSFVTSLSFSNDAVKKKEYKQDTLFSSKNMSHGGYGGLVAKYTKINGKNALLLGVRGGWIINHTFVIGVGGYGLAPIYKNYTLSPRENDRMDMGYGGILLEFIVLDRSIIHISFGALTGGGAVTYNKNKNDIDQFAFIEPEFNLIVNVFEWMRLGVGGSYRFVRGINREGSSNSSLSGPAGHILFKFGKF